MGIERGAWPLSAWILKFDIFLLILSQIRLLS